MIIGKLRHRLTLKSPTQTVETDGTPTVSYSTSTTVWGSLRPLSGKEISAAEQISEEVNYRSIIRYNSSIQSEWRVENDSKTYEVISVMNYDERDEYLILDLKAIR